MHLVLSGEGNSDIGKLSHSLEEFIPAPMYSLIDKIIEQKLGYSFYELTPDLITFVPKAELIKIQKKFISFPSKGKNKETALFFKNARTLAMISQKKSEELDDEDVITILFRDSDGTVSTIKGMWDKKIQSIEKGFTFENFNKGVAMMPNPKSEVWLLCALKNKYLHCSDLENRSGNDNSPNNLKDELESFGISYNETSKINEMIKDGRIDINKIDIPSFRYFVERLNILL